MALGSEICGTAHPTYGATTLTTATGAIPNTAVPACATLLTSRFPLRCGTWDCRLRSDGGRAHREGRAKPQGALPRSGLATVLPISTAPSPVHAVPLVPVHAIRGAPRDERRCRVQLVLTGACNRTLTRSSCADSPRPATSLPPSTIITRPVVRPFPARLAGLPGCRQPGTSSSAPNPVPIPWHGVRALGGDGATLLTRCHACAMSAIFSPSLSLSTPRRHDCCRRVVLQTKIPTPT